MKETETFHLELAGQIWEVQISRRELEEAHIPFVEELASRSRERDGRFIPYLGSPPGGGKSTLASLWKTISYERGESIEILPLDGFHFPNAYLRSHEMVVDWKNVSMLDMKGAPETYDLGRIISHLQALRNGDDLVWPIYDRRLHDVVTEGFRIERKTGVFLIEGNYLLLDEPAWSDGSRFADLKIFLETPEAICRERTIARHIRGGRTPEDAALHYERCDHRNFERVNSRRVKPDVVFVTGPSGGIWGPFWQ